MTEIRWLEPEEFPEVNALLERHGWAKINELTARVAGAFEDGQLVEVFVLQLFPMIGPLVRADHERRDDGATSRLLAEWMYSYIHEVGARGALAICDHPATERLCRRFGMTPLDKPVYQHIGI